MGGVLMALHWSLLGGSPVVLDIARAIVFIKFSGILFQLEVFMRTDAYALFVVATGCRNLWATKGAVARQLIRRPTDEDLAVLAAVRRWEIRWAHVYLLLYVPGIAWMIWYFGAFAVPALLTIVELALDAIESSGLVSLAGSAGVLALILSVGPMLYGLWGVARTLARLAAQILHPRTASIDEAASTSPS
jgi:putative peptide zinc metalloprotease protein